MDQSASAALPTPPKRRRWLWVVLAVGLVLTPFAWDYLTIGRPIYAALSQDPRNEGFKISVHRQYRVIPRSLVIDLRSVESASPVDLIRSVFVSADVLQKRGSEFERVYLARRGKIVFMMEGAAFDEIGAEYGAGQNPVYLVRTFPEKLHHPDGNAAFGQWTGGIFGVLGKQMEDVTTAIEQWAGTTTLQSPSY
jgi:hypothetical protein